MLSRWSELIVASYPEEYARFVGRERDRFQNPVGHAVAESIGALFDGIVSNRETSELVGALDELVRIRAVQDFSASQAVAFLFLLKRIIRDEVEDERAQPAWVGEARELDARIDELALAAFDIYALCRERIHDLRVNELRRRTHQLLKRVDGVVEKTATASNSHVKGAT